MPGPMEGAVASILLQVPFFKHIFGWVGGHEAGSAVSPAQNLHFATALLQTASQLTGNTWEMTQDHGIPIGESAVNTCLHRMT